MHEQGRREVEHTVDIEAPAGEIYRLIAEVQNWPQIFPPTVHVDRIEHSERNERIRIWATANGDVKSWISRRVLDPENLRIEFRQEVSAPPVSAMGGTWLIEPVSGGSSRVRLLHDYQAINDDPDHLAWIDQAVDRNSRSELAALKANIELVTSDTADLSFAFTDTVRIDGAAKDVYDFINDAHLWQERLPHVARVVMTEDSPGLQTLEMDTSTKDGSTHTTKSIRVCFPYRTIVYKQITLPALMTLHTGYWLLTDDDSGVTATSQHTVVLNPANITSVLGPDAGVPEARDFVRKALSTNSLATLGYAKEYAESRR